MASVVIIRPATDAASCRATRTTFAGSTMPAFSMSTYCSVCASKPKVGDLFSSTLPTTIEPSTPEFSAIWRIGASRALSTMLMPAWMSALSPLSLPIACAALPAKQSAKEAQEGDADAGKAADKPEPHD